MSNILTDSAWRNGPAFVITGIYITWANCGVSLANFKRRGYNNNSDIFKDMLNQIIYQILYFGMFSRIFRHHPSTNIRDNNVR